MVMERNEKRRFKKIHYHITYRNTPYRNEKFSCKLTFLGIVLPKEADDFFQYREAMVMRYEKKWVILGNVLLP